MLTKRVIISAPWIPCCYIKSNACVMTSRVPCIGYRIQDTGLAQLAKSICKVMCFVMSLASVTLILLAYSNIVVLITLISSATPL